MLLRLIPAVWTLTVVVLFVFTDLHAQPKSRADCEEYALQSNQYGKDVVWLPTPSHVVYRMLAMAETTANDYVVDLGSGDGKIVIAAAKNFGARALGIEYEPDLVKLANCLAQVENVADRAKILRGDIFKEDFSEADVVTMYLLPQLNLCIRHRLLAMKPGTRVTSHAFPMDDWLPDKKIEVDFRTVYLWIVPARVGGSWNFREEGGKFQFNVDLDQVFQEIQGEAVVNRLRQPLINATLRGEEIHFAFDDDKGMTHRLAGFARGNKITGVLKAADGAKMQVIGTPEGELVTGEWTEMASDCAHYYAR